MENYYNFCIQQYNKRHRIPENSKKKNGQKMKHLAAIAAYLINNIPNLIKSSYYESSCPSSFTRGVKYSSSGHLCIFSCYLLTFFLSFIFFSFWPGQSCLGWQALSQILVSHVLEYRIFLVPRQLHCFHQMKNISGKILHYTKSK